MPKVDVHVVFNESQTAMILAQCLKEQRSLGSLVKSATMQYIIQCREQGVKLTKFCMFSPQKKAQ